MATYSWSVPTGNIITGSTYIKDTDNKIQDTMDDLADFVNSSGTHTGQGLMFDYVNKVDNQTITGIKTFSNGIISNVTGNVTGTLTGNITGTAPKLATARTITLAGDVTGSLSFDGSANTSMTATIADNSHSHTIANVTGLETALDGKLSTSGNATTATKLATARTISLTGDVTGSVSFDGSANASISSTFTLPKFIAGMIMLWSGSTGSIPSGWVLCNGSNNTPNLTNRFVIGAGSSYAVGATGGSADAEVVSHTHTASTNSTGEHTHTYEKGDGGDQNMGGGTLSYEEATTGNTSSAGAHSHTVSVSSSGVSGTDKNLPPYYALAFIMKA